MSASVIASRPAGEIRQSVVGTEETATRRRDGQNLDRYLSALANSETFSGVSVLLVSTPSVMTTTARRWARSLAKSFRRLGDGVVQGGLTHATVLARAVRITSGSFRKRGFLAEGPVEGDE